MRVSNFRKYKNSPWIDLKAINCFVGTNGSGKSTMVKAYLLLYAYLKANKLFEIDFSHELFQSLYVQSFEELCCKQDAGNELVKIELDIHEVEYELHLTAHPLPGFAKVAYLKIDNPHEKVKYEFFQNDELAQKTGYDKQIKITFWSNDAYEDEVMEDLEHRLNQKTKSPKAQLKKLLRFFNSRNGEDSVERNFVTLSEEMPRMSIHENASFLDKSFFNDQPLHEYVYDSNHRGIAHRFDNEIIGSFKYFMNYFAYTNKWNSDYTFEYQFNSYLENQMEVNQDAVIAHYRMNHYFHGLGLAQTLVDLSLHYLPLNFRKYSRLLKISDRGDDLAQLVHRYASMESDTTAAAHAFITQWMEPSRFGIGDGFSIELVYHDSYLVRIGNEGLSLHELGSGQIQLMKILFQMGLIIKQNKGGATLLLEEPELNLHPSLQSKLADLFVDTYHTLQRITNRPDTFSFQLILETHSEYIIRRIQVLIATEEVNSSLFSIYYFPQPSDQSPYAIQMNEMGVMNKNFGKGFFDEASHHTLALIKRQLNNSNEA